MNVKAPILLYFLLIFSHGSLFSDDLLEIIKKQNDILSPDKAFKLTEKIGQIKSELDWEIAPEHYLYLDDVKLQYNKTDIVYSVQESYQSRYDDIFFGNVPILKKRFRITFAMPKILDITQDTITVNYRGCAEAGFCYPMKTVTYTISNKIL